MLPSGMSHKQASDKLAEIKGFAQVAVGHKSAHLGGEVSRFVELAWAEQCASGRYDADKIAAMVASEFPTVTITMPVAQAPTPMPVKATDESNAPVKPRLRRGA